MKKKSEEATGLRESATGIGTIYDTNGNVLESSVDIRAAAAYRGIEVPNAGSGSYDDVFKNMGFDEVKVIDWTSSAGDWCFGVRLKKNWFRAYQSNRYPRYGFLYSIDNSRAFKSFEDAANHII